MHIKNLTRALLGSFAVLALAFAVPAAAAGVNVNTWLHGVADATSTTFATTSYADLTGASVSVVPIFDPTIVEAPGTPTRTPYLKVTFTGTMSKATGTTGTCAVYANGAEVAKTAQLVTFLSGSANNNVHGTWYLPNTLATTQTVKMRCKSADTSVLTVAAGHLIVEEVR